MAIRIRYYQRIGYKVSDDFQVLDKLYYAAIEEANTAAIIFERDQEGSYNKRVLEFSENNLHILKKKIKAELIKLGVRFEQEVRRKRSQKEAIENALKQGENNE